MCRCSRLCVVCAWVHRHMYYVCSAGKKKKKKKKEKNKSPRIPTSPITRSPPLILTRILLGAGRMKGWRQESARGKDGTVEGNGAERKAKREWDKSSRGKYCIEQGKGRGSRPGPGRSSVLQPLWYAGVSLVGRKQFTLCKNTECSGWCSTYSFFSNSLVLYV